MVSVLDFHEGGAWFIFGAFYLELLTEEVAPSAGAYILDRAFRYKARGFMCVWNTYGMG